VLAPEKGARSAWVLASFRNARVVEPFRCRGGPEGARWQRIIRAHERNLAFLGGRPGARALDEPGLVALGVDLFEALFPGDVRRLYDTARSLQPRGVLDVTLTSMIHWVADKPWELAHDPARGEFLATSCVDLARNVFTSVPADAPRRRSGRLRVLLASARPAGTAPLGVEEETAALRRALRPLLRSRRAVVEALPRATARQLQRRLAEDRVDVLHFAGHGAFDPATGEGAILLEDERGRPRPLSFAAFRQLVCRRGLRLVSLNACETGRGGRLDWTHGMAGALLAGGVPAVVANQYPVGDAAAITFAGELFAALARGRLLGEAVREARLALAREANGSGLEWAIPVLFARDARERLR
jgi:hypothetical protein